jgi:acyl carrier protein
MKRIEQAVLSAVNLIRLRRRQIPIEAGDLCSLTLDDLDFDSMDRLDLVMALEDYLDRLISGAGVAKVRTLTDLIQFLKRTEHE